jgi:Protein of unknown function (DUF2634)
MAEARLFPVSPTPDVMRARPRRTALGTPVLPDLAFDFAAGDLHRTSDGDIALAERVSTIRQQVYSTLLTEQTWHLAHRRLYGIGYHRALRRRRLAEAQADIEQQVRAQLRRIRGVASVDQLTWTQAGDRLYLRFVVQLVRRRDTGAQAFEVTFEPLGMTRPARMR